MATIFAIGNKKFNLILKVCLLVLAINVILLVSNRVFAACPYGPATGSCASGTCDGICCGSSCCEGACAVPTTTTVSTVTTTTQPVTTTTSPSCTPTCVNKNCGGNGCGGSCGSCGAGGTCYYGYCSYPCIPSCAGKSCGANNGCAGTCLSGSCPTGQTCNFGTCTGGCVPSCAGKACGASDGCSSICVTGSCQPGYNCNYGTCECTTNCTGKACGAPDGCGGICQSGSCPTGQTCSSGVCSTAKHRACVVGQCILMDGAGSDTCTINSDCFTSTYKACSNGACTIINGVGTDRCSTNAECANTHGECQSNTCVRVSGAGLDKCVNNSDCWVQTHKGCFNGQCETLIGLGEDTCNGYPDCQIAPTEHTVCNAVGTCTKIPGAGTNECANPRNFCGAATYKACVTGQCISINGTGTDRCTDNASCVNTHAECQDNTCISVSGSGISTCVNNSNCWIQKHKICSYNSGIGTYGCIEVQGLGDDECDAPANCAPISKYSCVNKSCVANNSGSYSSLATCITGCQKSPGTCQNGETQSCTVNGCPGTQICSDGSWGECADNAGDGCPVPETCTYTACECSGGNCQTVTKTGTTPCKASQSCISCPAYNTCSPTGTCSVSQPGSTIMSGSCPTGCTSNAECPPGVTKNCNWTACSPTELCNVPKSSIIPIDQNCPTGCSGNGDCTLKINGTTIINSVCGTDSVTVTADVNGGVTPYKKYTWYKQIDSGAWNIDYEQICPVGGCGSSHIYALFGQTINAYLRVEDNTRAFWASNILNINCSNVCVNGATQNCTTSSNCPGNQTCANSAWGTCTDIPNDGCPAVGGCVNGSTQGCVTSDNCPGNQTCIGNVWGSCLDVPNDNCPAVSVCTIDSASVTPAPPKIIYLGGKFKVTWQTTDCSTCTITCNDLAKCGVNGLVQPVGDSGEVEIKPTASGYYAYKITCDGGVGGVSSIVLPSTDVWDGMSPTLKTNIGAYRVRRPFIFETPAFLKILVDKLFSK